MRSGLRAAIARFIAAIKNLATLNLQQFSDSDWRKLVNGARRYVRTGDGSPVGKGERKSTPSAKFYDEDFGSVDDLLRGLESGELLVHARVPDGTDFEYGIDPSAGAFLQSTEGYQSVVEEFGEGPELTFFAQDLSWAKSEILKSVRGNAKNLELVFVRRDSENMQKSLGNGMVELPDGSVVRYELSPIADYESDLYKEEPAGVETGDWYTNQTVDVVGVVPANQATRYSTPPKQTQTPEFKRWFGDSKVVDENGEPLVVYHGTDQDFSEFKISRTGWLGKGFYFTDNREQAARYGKNVMAVYLKADRIVNTLTGKIEGDGKAVATKGRAAVGKGTVYVVTKPTQIKSATGNTGAFDPDNPDIRYSTPKRNDEQKAALAKAGMPVDERGLIQRLADLPKKKWEEIKEDAKNPKQRIFDRFHRMSAIEADLGVEPEHSAYISARLAQGLPSIMEAVMLYGAPKWKDGVLAKAPGTVGLLDALKPVQGDLNGWLGWMVGRRAQALSKQGRENLMTDADIKALLSLADGKEKEFKEAALNYLRIKKAILDVAQEAGLIDAASRATWDSVEYIPFYRESEVSDRVGPGTRKGLDGQTAGIRKLKGGEQNLADPLGNIVMNFTKLIDASLKNNAMTLAVDEYGDTFFEKVPMSGGFERIPMSQVKKVLLEQGVPQQMIDQMPANALTGLQKMWAIKPPNDDDVVRIMRNGKPEYYRVPDKELLRSLTSFKAVEKNLAIKPFIWSKRLLTAGVTSTPDFMARNFIRDTGATWVLNDDRMRLGWDAAVGIVKPLVDNSDQISMMFAGGSFIGGHIHGGSPDETAKALRRALRAKGLKSKQIEDHIATVMTSPLAVWDRWQKVGSALENANRNAIYEAAIKAGRSEKEAAYLARDIMDFSMQGDSAAVQFFADVLPFFNARLQGNYKIYRQSGKEGLRKSLLLRAGTISAGTLSLLAWNLLMYADGYDELEEWDKDAYWHIAPGTKAHIRIPKPFELGVLFATIPERLARAVTYQVPGGDTGDRPAQTAGSIRDQISGTLAMNPIPQGVMPLVELWANKSFFTGRPIENMGDEQRFAEARAEWYTSDTLKALVDFVPGAANALEMSPKRLEHLWNGYTGSVGGYALDISDAIVRYVGDTPERPEMNWSEMPLIKAIYRGADVPRNTRYVTEFYDLSEKANEATQTIKDYIVEGNEERAKELESQYGWLLGNRVKSKGAKAGFMHERVREINKVKGRLAEIRKEINGIVVMRGFTDTQKRTQIDKLTAERNKLTEELTRSLRQSERQYRPK